jgi:2-keto-4-pentenoate hydratase/2-oxohepta-3-ene-1,7-dioic acid hydratase in catechol pathway
MTMKVASFVRDGAQCWGVVEGDWVIDLGRGASGHPTLRAALAAGDGGRFGEFSGRGERVPIADVVWAPVVPDAGKILCVGHNYESHRKETGRAAVAYPSVFVRFADSQVGHEDAIVLPPESTSLDFEGELAVIIGRGGRRIAAADALAHVAGYSCYNDASIRDWQWHTQQFTPGKNFPATGGSGPWMTTADEIPDPAALQVTTRLNGEVVQDQPTSQMLFPIPTIIAYISTFTPLSPGDIILTGTPGGVGAKREPPLWMRAGDSVEVDIPGVGLLRNAVRAEAEYR